MSFEAVTAAMKADPELAKEVMAATTPAERAAILEAHGIEKPHAQSKFPEMADTAGGNQGTTTDIGQGAAATAAAA